MTTVKKPRVEISGLIRSLSMKHMKMLWKYFWREPSIRQQFDTHFHCLSAFLGVITSKLNDLIRFCQINCMTLKESLSQISSQIHFRFIPLSNLISFSNHPMSQELYGLHSITYLRRRLSLSIALNEQRSKQTLKHMTCLRSIALHRCYFHGKDSNISFSYTRLLQDSQSQELPYWSTSNESLTSSSGVI